MALLYDRLGNVHSCNSIKQLLAQLTSVAVLAEFSSTIILNMLNKYQCIQFKQFPCVPNQVYFIRL